LYSNGTAVISRQYKLEKGPNKISIPVRKDDLDEVVASVGVFGNVTTPVPPSYTPVNAKDTKLDINPASALKDTATKLAGSQVGITKASGPAVYGTLVGVHTYEETNANGMTTERLKVVVQTENGIQMVAENDISFLKFTDPATQDEYNKALAASYQKIKPDSSFVDLTIVPNEDNVKSAVVGYATPVAAWKPRYQLRSTNGVWELQSEAVVDNDTDDAWLDSIISVITGEPITFQTDLAEIRRPARTRVNVVSDQAQGAVGVEDTVARAKVANVRARGGAAMRLQSLGAPVPAAAMGFAAESLEDGEYEAAGGSANYCADSIEVKRQADAPQAEVRESGDFSIFTSPNPVSIASKKSGIIPMFRAFLQEAKTVLVYNKKNHPTRPFRALEIVNETKHPLGKGVCEIYLDGDFQGKSILEATGPGQPAFLVHAKETGVKCHATEGQVESRRVGIKIKDGVVTCEQASRTETTYTVTNNKNEPFTYNIEHARRLPHSKCGVEVSEGEAKVSDTPSGWRITLSLPAFTGPKTGEVEVTITENSVDAQAWGINNGNGPLWIQQNIIAVKNPLSRNGGIKKIIDLQAKVDDLDSQIEEAEEREETLTKEQENLLKLIPNGHADQANEWKTELGTNKADLKTLQRETLPGLKKQQREATQAVQEALNDLVANWSEKVKDNGNNEPVGAGAASEQ
jgi:hypothetical protein